MRNGPKSGPLTDFHGLELHGTPVAFVVVGG